MNSTNQAFINHTVPVGQDMHSFYRIIKQIDKILITYIMRSIGGLGFITNLFFLYVYSNKTLKNLYVYQWCHCFTNMVVCLFVSIYFEITKDSESYYFLIICFLITFFLLRTALNASLYSDLLRVFNRYSSLTNRKNFLSKLSKWSNLGICFGLAMSIRIPTYIGINIEKSETQEKFFWNMNDFGYSNLWIIYLLLTALIDPLILLIISTILNILSIQCYRKATLEKKRLQHSIDKTKKKELRFTKTVLIVNIIYILSRCFEMICRIIFSLTLSETVRVSSEIEILVKGVTDFSYTVLIAVHAFESLIYLKMDVNVKKVVVKIFKCETVRIKF